EMNPGASPFQIPPPQNAKLKDGTIYFYPLPPQLGLDAQFLPNASVSSRMATISLSKSHAERLLTKTSLKVDGGPLSDSRRKITGAMYLDWPGLVDLFSPWVEFGVQMAKASMPEQEGAPAAPWGEISRQIPTVIELLKVIRGYSSCTYFENGKQVT